MRERDVLPIRTHRFRFLGTTRKKLASEEIGKLSRTGKRLFFLSLCDLEIIGNTFPSYEYYLASTSNLGHSWPLMAQKYINEWFKSVQEALKGSQARY